MSQRELVIGLFVYGLFGLYDEQERKNKNVKRIQRCIKVALEHSPQELQRSTLAQYSELVHHLNGGTVKPAKIVASVLSLAGDDWCREFGVNPEWARRLSRLEGEGCMRESLAVARVFMGALDGKTMA